MLVVEGGADLWARDGMGRTPSQAARQGGQPKCAELLEVGGNGW